VDIGVCGEDLLGDDNYLVVCVNDVEKLLCVMCAVYWFAAYSQSEHSMNC